MRRGAGAVLAVLVVAVAAAAGFAGPREDGDAATTTSAEVLAGATATTRPRGTTSTIQPTSTTSTTVEPAAPAPELPTLTSAEIAGLVEVLSFRDGTWIDDGPIPILGDPAADARIRVLAEERGYRRRPVLVVGAADLDGFLVHPDAVQPVRDLLDAIRRDGHVVELRSTLRTPAQQALVFGRELEAAAHARIGRPYTNEEIASGAADAAIDVVLAYHSIPGYSRHHSGLAVDLGVGPGPLANFTGSPAEEWLRADGFANAMRHGFLPSYPVGVSGLGPQPESWEYVYVGADDIRCAALHIDVADPEARRACPLAD